jgi:hypothetical protein
MVPGMGKNENYRFSFKYQCSAPALIVKENYYDTAHSAFIKGKVS